MSQPDENEQNDMEAWRLEKIAMAKGAQYVRKKLSDQDSLVALKPNEDGFVAVWPYHGQPFDPKIARLVKGGWDHEHCFLCLARVIPGDEWWAIIGPSPPFGGDQFGLCLACHERLFGASQQ